MPRPRQNIPDYYLFIYLFCLFVYLLPSRRCYELKIFSKRRWQLWVLGTDFHIRIYRTLHFICCNKLILRLKRLYKTMHIFYRLILLYQPWLYIILIKWKLQTTTRLYSDRKLLIWYSSNANQNVQTNIFHGNLKLKHAFETSLWSNKVVIY